MFIMTLLQNDPQIIIASIEKISDLNVQKALLHVHLDYVAIDEAQVRLIKYKFVKFVSLVTCDYK